VGEFDALHAVEELDVFRITARPATLDVVNTEGVQSARDADLVFNAERDPLAL